MSTPWKSYCVSFCVRDYYTMKLKARSEDEALAKAEDLYSNEGEAPFTMDLSEGGTDEWYAEEVQS